MFYGLDVLPSISYHIGLYLFCIHYNLLKRRGILSYLALLIQMFNQCLTQVHLKKWLFKWAVCGHMRAT